MFISALLALNAVLFLFIFLYGLCLLCLPFVKPESKKAVEGSAESLVSEAVDILIPCHHEGEGLVRTVESVIEQDYHRNIQVILLMKDRTDSSCDFLEKRFDIVFSDETEGILFEAKNRTVTYRFCGVAPKREKLNQVLGGLTSPYVAFLDADHRAEVDWIRTSLKHLHDSNYVGVQSRRKPLSLKKLPQLWDSAQNHIGNELVNDTLSTITDNVFFTGTTAVFKTDVLKDYEFGDCVTEDTYLSYELLADGHQLAFNEESGSREEVAPDFHSYVARRRRWSCGHNKTFFSRIRSIVRAPISWKIKASCIIHGLFYMVPVAACLLLNGMALHLFVQYTQGIQLLIVLLAVTISACVTLFMYGRHKSVIREILVLSFLLFPKVTLLFPVPLYYAEHELFYFLIVFPYLEYVIWLEIVCLFSPLLLVLLGSRRKKILLPHQIVLFVLSYYFVIFFDLWACLLGFSDFLFGRPTWAKIQRTQEEDVFEESVHSNSWWMIVRSIASCSGVVLLFLSINDFTADSNCGDPDGLFMNPQIFVPASDLEWDVRKSMEYSEDGSLLLTFQSTFSKALREHVQIAHRIDDTFLSSSEGNKVAAHQAHYKTTAGWEDHTYSAMLRSGDVICKREVPFTTVVKELKNNRLYVNGEPFLVKGVIPSYSYHTNNIDPEQGLRQIKELGANTVRYYHSLTERLKNEISDEQLFVVDQPDRSTWRDVSVGVKISRKMLEKRFTALLEDHQDFPFSLLSLLGNELEIHNPQGHLSHLMNMLQSLGEKHPQDLIGYATYFIYLQIPNRIYCVNMLDSGSSYWEKGIRQLTGLGKLFLATEFGGFVAHHEWTPSALRGYRFLQYWDILMNNNALGAIIHQSHDNWAQPIVSGANDPFSADRPDDVRGIWTPDNEEKSFKKVVERVFSDLEVDVTDEVIAEDEKMLGLNLHNRRLFDLHDVALYHKDTRLVSGIDIPAGEGVKVKVSLPDVSGNVSLKARYESHKGLSGVSTLSVSIPRKTERLTVLNWDANDVVREAERLRGTLLTSKSLEFMVPDGVTSVRVNGTSYPVTSNAMKVPMRSAMEAVSQLEWSSDALTWKSITPKEVGIGPQRVRFKLTRRYPEDAYLLLSGLGTEEFWIRVGTAEWKKFESHTYRENILKLSELTLDPEEYIYLLLPRHETVFLERILSPLGEEVSIDFEMPKVFSPPKFVLELDAKATPSR